MSNDVKLEFCPFCGGPAQIIAGAPGCYYVRCEGCSVTSDDGSRERVITKWNTRHQPHREAVLDEALRVAKREIQSLGCDPDDIELALTRINRAALTTPAPAVSRDEIVAALDERIAATEADVIADSEDAETTGERPDMYHYTVELTLDEARTILSRLQGDKT